jgi:glycosyltransferase involved in cell wall biosynthesis
MHARKVEGESLDALRDTNRKVRILFAGDLEGYKRRWIRYPKQKLSRVEVISTIKERLGEQLRVAKTPEELDEIRRSEYTGQFVIVDNDGARVPWDQWVDVIAQADFFLCPPGIVMPMCHNIIEAMAIGTIPITNYPEWLSPRLEHMKNCIVFDGQDDLIEKINLAMAMTDAQKNEIRENAMQYYERHLKPQTFVKKVEDRKEGTLDVLMYSEYNVAKKAAKLNGASVLMRGEDAVGDWAWVANAWRS